MAEKNEKEIQWQNMAKTLKGDSEGAGGRGVGPGELCGRSIKYSPFFPTSTHTHTPPGGNFCTDVYKFSRQNEKTFLFFFLLLFGGHKVVRKSAAKLKL